MMDPLNTAELEAEDGEVSTAMRSLTAAPQTHSGIWLNWECCVVEWCMSRSQVVCAGCREWCSPHVE